MGQDVPVTLFIPSPPISGFQIGPVFIHIYALCLITGMIAAGWLALRRWRARGGKSETLENVILVAIPVGLVGARIYHVLTHMGDYFGPGHLNPFAIWEGGIAIFGAIMAGSLGAFIATRRMRIRFSSVADALAPGIAIGQALGRFGNWFNQELYGLPTTLPWGLEIDPAHRVPGYEQYATFHPTFAYESLWDVGVAGALLWVDRRFAMGRGKLFALYMALYTFGRIFTEQIRIDYSYDTFGPIRFNTMAAIVMFVCAVAVLVWMLRTKPGREPSVSLDAPAPDVVDTTGGAEGAEPAEGSEDAEDDPEDVDDDAPDDTGPTPRRALAGEGEDPPRG